MCKFDKAWIGKCKNENIEGQEYCEEHLKVKCSICGSQSTHDCAETMQFVCGTPLCDSSECKLTHFYQTHGYAFLTIASLEKKLDIKPSKIVISKINYGVGEFAEWANEKYKDRLELLLMTFDKNNEVKFYKANFRYYVKFKEEIPELIKGSWYEDEINEKGVYYYNEVINIEEKYTEDIINKFEKITF